jgi:phosphoglycerate dehydrogenase-like enzyme
MFFSARSGSAPPMDPVSGRLLVGLPRRPELEAAVGRWCPGQPVSYGASSLPTDGRDTVAMFVGSVEREFPDFDSRQVPKLQFVQRIYTGLDDFPFDRFPASVAVAGNVGGFAPFVAEQAIALVFAAAKAILPHHEMVRQGRLRPTLPNVNLLGRTVLILGFGAIAQAIAERIRPFGARVFGVNRSGETRPGAERMFPADQLVAALQASDIVIDCRPLTRTTRGSIGRLELEAMKPTALLVNVGRGATVDEAALFEHLRNHPTFRAGFEAWWTEDFETGTLTTHFPFAELPNFVGTPHSAANGPEDFRYALDRALENLARFFRGERPWYIADRTEYVPASA